MRPFAYQRAEGVAEAVRAARGDGEAAFLAGGTTLVDLMRLDVMRPERLVDINGLARDLAEVRVDDGGLHLGALARMSDVAANRDVARAWPVISQSLAQAASPQLRNMASVGGNILQRTRCPYFRDVSWEACNKRRPGSGCAATTGVNRRQAVLGVGSACIAAYPGDFAQALVALDAVAETVGPRGGRRIPVEDIHRLPADTPHIETTLDPGELIIALHVPAAPWMRRSLYLKIRDRQSYDFALASAAVALDVDGGAVREARIALGGVATRPWRAREAEAILRGRRLDEASAQAAAQAAFAGAVTHGENAFKPELGRRTLVRALLEAGRMEA